MYVVERTTYRLEAYVLMFEAEKSRGGSVSLSRNFELPFVPFVGLGLKYGENTNDDSFSDELLLEEVFWNCDNACFLSITQQPSYDLVEDIKYYEAYGWETDYVDKSFSAWVRRRKFRLIPNNDVKT